MSPQITGLLLGLIYGVVLVIVAAGIGAAVMCHRCKSRIERYIRVKDNE